MGAKGCHEGGRHVDRRPIILVPYDHEVDRNEQAQRAIEIAEEVFGVVEVHGRLRVGEREGAAGAG